MTPNFSHATANMTSRGQTFGNSLKAWNLRVGRSFWWLRELLVRRVGHESSEFNQYSLHSHISSPVRKAGQFGRVDNTISWANARKVDFADELDSGWLVRILIAAVHLQGVNSILMDTMWRTKNSAIPVRHQEVISFCESIGACLSTKSLLALF